MRERPILFSGPMIRALPAGTKTQTRRAVKPQSDEHHWQGLPGYEVKRSEMVTIDGRCAVKFAHSIPQNRAWDDASRWVCCPYGAPGDRLWTKETFIAFGRWETRYSAEKGRDEWHFVDMTLEAGKQYGYAADGDWPWPFPAKRRLAGATPTWWTRPAIFMPRAASRITLEVTGVRVERLQDISEADAVAEGVTQQLSGWWSGAEGQSAPDARSAYALLWQSINGPASWDANPWVWVVEFRRIVPASPTSKAGEGE